MATGSVVEFEDIQGRGASDQDRVLGHVFEKALH